MTETNEAVREAARDSVLETQRREADCAQDVSELRYRRLFESAKDGILILDAQTGHIEDANPFMSELLGYSREQFLGKELWEIGLFKDIEESRAAFRELQEKGYIRYENLPLKGKGGERREVEFISNSYPVGDRLSVQCNIRDITERKRMERLLQEQAKQLADAHRRKDEFLAMLSHELRNPLAPIVNALHVLRLQDGQDPLQEEARGVIERQVRHLSRLVNDLLEVSRITTGRIRLQLERVALGGIVEQAVETFRSLIDRHRQILAVSLPKEPIWVEADSTRLEQVVGNLLGNAVKFTGEGGRIWITLDQEGQDAVLRVKDSGIGISAELLPRIFDLFTQADKSLDRSDAGLGIGLALVKSLVEMHRGRVQAQSAGPQQGSEFIVRLPLLTAAPVRAELPAAPLANDHRGRSGRAKAAIPLRVLVVDDVVDIAKMSAVFLRACGHDTRMAHSGKAALEAALDFQPHVVLLDIGLPEMDGYEVARRFRQHPQLKDMGLMAVTGYGQDSDRQRSREAGFDEHLVKPVEPDHLLQVLADFAAGMSPRLCFPRSEPQHRMPPEGAVNATA
jgi:PAS domain S-box-containing protein